MKKLIPLFISILLFFSGCASPRDRENREVCRVVTGISIRCERETGVTQRHYTDQHKMRKVLTYLRWLDPWDRARPDSSDGTAYEIRLDFSDGSSKQYSQKSDRYFRPHGSFWREIDPDRGGRLDLLLAAVPDDTPVAQNSGSHP